jgi:hypothetical protein
VPRRPLSTPEHVAARIVTGPAAHLVAGVADWLELLARYGWDRLRGRLPGSS